MKPNYLIPAAFISLIPLCSLSASDSVTAGEFIVEPATFHNAGFEWKISGDDNRNATVSVRFREVGETSWRGGQPLLAHWGREGLAGPRILGVLDSACLPEAFLDWNRAKPMSARSRCRIRMG